MAGGLPLLAERAKRRARVVLAQALFHTGVLRLLQTIRLRQKAVVLMYHRVLTDEQIGETGSHPGIIVTRDTFATQMALLKRRFSVLSLEEFAGFLRRGEPFPDSSCLITFDDGWLDNFDNALPILRAHALPAVIFLPVNFVGSDRSFWRETLTLLLTRTVSEARRDPGKRRAFHAILDRFGLAPMLETGNEALREALSDALAPLKGAPRDRIAALIEELSEALGVRAADLTMTDRFMNWGRVDAMSKHGIAFGGHGAEHLILSELSNDEVESEVSTARTVVDERTSPRVLAFSYPNGNYTPAVVEAVGRAGFLLAFTTDNGTVGAGDDPFTLRRVNISEDVTRTSPMFLARVLGLF